MGCEVPNCNNGFFVKKKYVLHSKHCVANIDFLGNKFKKRIVELILRRINTICLSKKNYIWVNIYC